MNLTIETIKRMLSEITQGKWTTGGISGRMITTVKQPYFGDGFLADVDTKANAEFIAASPEIVRFLLDRVEKLEKSLLRDETVDYRAEQAHWILMKQVKELELKYQAARNVLLEYASLDENGVSKSMNESDIRYVDEQIESELQRLKEETNDNT